MCALREFPWSEKRVEIRHGDSSYSHGKRMSRITPAVRQSPDRQCSLANDSIWPHLHPDMPVCLCSIRSSLWKLGGEACNTTPLCLCTSLADGKRSHRFRCSFVLPGASLTSRKSSV